MYSSVRAAMSSSRGSTRCRHPTNGRAIRRSPAGPLDLTRSAPVEAASSRLPATFQKENTILTDGVSFVTGCRFCCPHPYTSQGRGSVRGEPLTGSPTRVQSPARRRPLLRSKSAAPKKKDTHVGVFLFWSGRRGSTRYRHPTNGRAIRRSPAGPLDLMRSAPVEAASSRLPATFQKENTILTDGVSFWSGRRGSNSLPRPWQGRALPDELRPQAAPLLQRLWCLRPGSNRRHADFQSAALPTELPRHMATKKGLEPSTSSVTGWRSNQLNYLAVWMVGTTGLEPVTPCL